MNGDLSPPGPPLPPGSGDRTKELRGWFLGAAALAVLAASIYGRHLADGYLSDDFLYLSWLRSGLGELLRRVTTESNPQVIRPLPALAWCLARVPAGAALQHGLSLLLHALAGWLVARLAARISGSRELGLLLAALFLSFPLLPEAVVWLSSGPDLWACVFALAALDLGLRTQPKIGAAALCFSLSLLSKESTLLLPLLPICLARWRETRRLCLALGAVALVYLAVRLLLFQGPGGYLDPDGRPLAIDPHPLRFLRNLALQLPFRTLVPLKRAGALAPLLGLASGALALAVVTAGGVWRRPRALGRSAWALFLALLPVAPLFSVDYDHENTRMLYFPIAVLAATVGAAFARLTAAARAAMLFLVGFWSIVTFVNGRPWSEGSREVLRTLEAMRAAESGYPAGATVLVAGHDTWRGAYVWRSGLAFAARLAGLRVDIHWTLGTAALNRRPADLGERVFEIGLDAAGRPRDWTPCQRLLSTARLGPLATRDLRGFSRASGDRAAGRIDIEPVFLSRATPALAVILLPTQDHRGRALEGRLFWRQRGTGGRFDASRFNVTDARRFRMFPGRRAVVRLPLSARPVSALHLRIELSGPAAAVDVLREVRVVELPEICR